MSAPIGGPGEWVGWSEAGDLVFVDGPRVGQRLGEIDPSRLAKIARQESTPPATRALLDAYTPWREKRRDQWSQRAAGASHCACGATLRSDNRTGLCGRHWQLEYERRSRASRRVA